MVYLLTISCMLLAAGICVASYIVINKHLQVSQETSCESDIAEISDTTADSDESSESDSVADTQRNEKICLKNILKQVFSTFTISRWVVFISVVLLIGFVCYCAQVMTWNSDGLDSIGIAKIIIVSEIMMSAAVIDFYIKKIPNFLPVTLLVAGIIFLIIEYFCMKNSFMILFVASILGLIGTFLILILMSLLTRGGIGMGDVKLISTMGFVAGIATSFYTFLYANILCLMITLLLLVTKMKKMKDELPFGPFLFIGYILVVVLGKF